MDKRLNIMAGTLLRVINKCCENQKKARFFGIPEPLYASEIHMVMHIGDNPGAHMAELARIAGVTRGAISQLVAKIEKKGLITRVGDPGNSLKTVPVLTNKGKVAYYAHEQHHEEVNAEIYDFFKGISENEFRTIEEFLRQLETMADRLR